MGKCECCVYCDTGDGFCYEYRTYYENVDDCRAYTCKCEICCRDDK